MLPQVLIKSVPKDTWGIQISVQWKVILKYFSVYKEKHIHTCSFSESQGPKGTCISIILYPRSWLQASHLQMADLTVLTTTELQNYHLNPCKVHRKRSRGRKINNKLFCSIIPVVLLLCDVWVSSNALCILWKSFHKPGNLTVIKYK